MSYIPRLGQGADNLRAWVARLEARFAFRPNEPVSHITKQEIPRDISKIER
jgi:glutathione S-transferase